MTECTFVHAADLHLDAPFRGLGESLSAGASGPGSEAAFAGKLATLLREASFIALKRLTKLCIRVGADFLLLAGDVYNSGESSLRARLALRDAFQELETAGIRVFLAHGNHDPLPQAGRSLLPWPGNVTVFGQSPETHTVFRDGEPVARIHGISHSGPRESGNLAQLLRGEQPALSGPESGPEIFQIGLLHCALSGLSGGHESYAPCAFSDLAEAEFDYWALGHVHACRVLDRQGKETAMQGGLPVVRPLAAYPGSLQGLHVLESGNHGCLLGRVDGAGGLSLRFVPVAPLQWERTQLEPGPEIADLEALESLLVEELSRLEPASPAETGETGGMASASEEAGFPPEAVLARLVLAGRSPLDHELRGQGFLDDLVPHLREELAGSGVWLRDIKLATRPFADAEAMLLRQDLAGEVLRCMRELQNDPEKLREAGGMALNPLLKQQRTRRAIQAPDADELALLVEEAAFLCLDLLEGGE